MLILLCLLLDFDENSFRFVVYNKNIMSERILFVKVHEPEFQRKLLIDIQIKVKNFQETEINVSFVTLYMSKKLQKNLFKILLEQNVISFNGAGMPYKEFAIQEKKLSVFCINLA